MNSFQILITLCLSVAAANVVRRQNSPPSPTDPPMQSGAPSIPPMSPSSAPASTAPPSPAPSSTMMVMQSSTTQPQPADTTMMTSAAPVVTMASSTMQMTDKSTMMVPDTTTMATSPTPKPEPTTTKKPTIDELVSVDEILEVFGNIATSEYFKKLPLGDQLIIMEILAGGETGKMSAVLDQIKLKDMLRLMYNLPFKYTDGLWRVINLGYTREEIIAA